MKQDALSGAPLFGHSKSGTDNPGTGTGDEDPYDQPTKMGSTEAGVRILTPQAKPPGHLNRGTVIPSSRRTRTGTRRSRSSPREERHASTGDEVDAAGALPATPPSTVGQLRPPAPPPGSVFSHLRPDFLPFSFPSGF